MQVLKNTRSVVIGAMQYADKTHFEDRQKVMTFLKDEIGCHVFDHYNKPFANSISENTELFSKFRYLMETGDYDEVHRIGKQIRNDDLRIIDISDFVIALIYPQVPTVGTIEEFSTAVRQKKPIFTYIHGGVSKCPLWLLWMMPPKYFYSDLEVMFNTIRGINSGEKNLDNNRWKLLKEEYR